MESIPAIPIKIQDKVVGVINIDEKAFTEICGEAGLEAIKGAGNLLALAIKSTCREKEIMALSNIQSDFISSFPHELRIPISVIKDTVSMIREGIMGEINSQQKKALELTANNIERLWRLSEELLELSAIAAAKTQMNRRLSDITGIVNRAIARHHDVAQKKGVTIDSYIANRKIEIWVDGDKLMTAVSNLIDNAVKFTASGGKVTVRLEETDEWVRINIADTGAGISPDDLDKVLDKFYRVTMRARGEDRKWGIGLPIVKEIVDMHRGKISVESEAGKGSVFTIVLPKTLRPDKGREGA